MQTFITDDFLLRSDFAKRLYHGYAKELPIIDYHNHLFVDQIAQNTNYGNITQVWLNGDHYKWRAMRALGVKEKYITGNADDESKFTKWSSCVPALIRNPLYHWTHLELKRYFDIDELLSEANAKGIYEKTQSQLKNPSHSVQGLLQQQNVELLCTTDDPIDSLEHHQKIKNGHSEIKVLPTFRPDSAMAVENPESYKNYIEKLEILVGHSIVDYDSYLEALTKRIDFFDATGCSLSDHGFECLYVFNENQFNTDKIFKSVLGGHILSAEEVQHFKMHTLLFLSRKYHKKGWVQQFHLGALRNNNKRLLSSLGADTGFDSMGDFDHGRALSQFLNTLDSTDQLPKTILYNINPRDNELFATMAGNFNDGTVKAKVQYGSAWWYLDQKDGIEKQLNTLSNMGVLSTFLGMLTDSRSFLSFPRHEYFRRVLCNLIGEDVKNGELPMDEKHLGKIVQGICYYNAKNYFDWKT